MVTAFRHSGRTKVAAWYRRPMPCWRLRSAGQSFAPTWEKQLSPPPSTERSTPLLPLSQWERFARCPEMPRAQRPAPARRAPRLTA
eukprot:scaffold125358_cov30-Tisochrysis_lutea.AAC.1